MISLFEISQVYFYNSYTRLAKEIESDPSVGDAGFLSGLLEMSLPSTIWQMYSSCPSDEQEQKILEWKEMCRDLKYLQCVFEEFDTMLPQFKAIYSTMDLKERTLFGSGTPQ